MNKLQILMLQLLGCLVLGIIMGTAFWWFDGGKSGVSNAQIKPVELYTGKWHKDYLEVAK